MVIILLLYNQKHIKTTVPFIYILIPYFRSTFVYIIFVYIIFVYIIDLWIDLLMLFLIHDCHCGISQAQFPCSCGWLSVRNFHQTKKTYNAICFKCIILNFLKHLFYLVSYSKVYLSSTDTYFYLKTVLSIYSWLSSHIQRNGQKN